MSHSTFKFQLNLGHALLIPQNLLLNNAEDVKIGVTRWDFWFKNTPNAQKLYGSWWSRIPFFAWLKDNREWIYEGQDQGTLDQEIGYARQGGIDYFNFLYYYKFNYKGELNPDRFGSESLNLYLNSRRKNEVKFTLTLAMSHLGHPAHWSNTVDVISNIVKDNSYLHVVDGRPLIYFFEMQYWNDLFKGVKKSTGDLSGGALALRELRQAIKKKTKKDPYFVLMHFYPDPTNLPKNVISLSELKKQLEMDAVSAYANPLGSANKQYDYAVCAEANRQFRESVKAGGHQVIPVVNTGWDYRPVAGNDPYIARSETPDFCNEATSVEIANNILSAKNWVKQNYLNSMPQTVLVYAWNELTEGGWLVPTHKDADHRLRTLRSKIKPFHKKNIDKKLLGQIDSVTFEKSRFIIRGWACNVGDSEPVRIDIASKDLNGKIYPITTWSANEYSEAAVQKLCESSGDSHRFVVDLPFQRVAILRKTKVIIYVDGNAINGIHSFQIP